MDPPNNDPNAVAYHGATSRGSASLNLLGGLPDPPPEPDDAQSFLLGVTNVSQTKLNNIVRPFCGSKVSLGDHQVHSQLHKLFR